MRGRGRAPARQARSFTQTIHTPIHTPFHTPHLSDELGHRNHHPAARVAVVELAVDGVGKLVRHLLQPDAAHQVT